MKVNYQREKWLNDQKQKTKDLMVRIVTDYNAGMTAKQIAEREGITRAYVYILLKRASELPIK